MAKRFILGIIPARGGSKGIPRKNITDICGKPLIYYTIKSAKESKYLNDVIVSTDDEEIAEISSIYGIKVRQLRPKYLAKDKTPTIKVLKYEISVYEKTFNIKITDIIILQPTTPLRTSKDIDQSLKIYIKNKGNSLISVYNAQSIHPYVMYIKKGNFLKPYVSLQDTRRRQEFPSIYVRNGVIYILTRNLLNKNRIISSNPLFYEMPQEKSINIDDYFNLEIARLFISKELKKCQI